MATCPFVIDGSSIDFVDSFPHLGHSISSESGDNEDVSHRRCKFIGQTNSELSDFWNVGSDGKCWLFKSFFVVMCTVVSCGIWVTIKLVISVSLGVKLCVERITILMIMVK